MGLPALELRPAFMAAATCVAEALGCEKVDAFLLDEASRTLRAAGTSETEMGRRQRALGLDALALANGGRTVRVFESGVSYLEHHADRDPDEVRGLVEELGVRSTLSAPIDVGGARRGVLAAASATPEFFQPNDLKFLEIVARWFGMMAQRAELLEAARLSDREQARRRGADEIITVLAHDLRNHIQPLLARLHTMRLNVEKGAAVTASQLDKTLSSVQRLSRLTEELLDLKRLDEGLFSVDLSLVDLAEIAREVAANLGSSAVAVQVTGEPSLVAVADAARLRQALENLVSNAIKYSPHGGTVELYVALDTGARRPMAVIEVLDEGPGISPEIVSSLFERFVRGSNSRGLGLGLHLAREIARAHRGELDVRAGRARGTCFRMRLPLDLSESDRAPAP